MREGGHKGKEKCSDLTRMRYVCKKDPMYNELSNDKVTLKHSICQSRIIIEHNVQNSVRGVGGGGQACFSLRDCERLKS